MGRVFSDWMSYWLDNRFLLNIIVTYLNCETLQVYKTIPGIGL
jgi:hypothetical protein